MSNLGGSRAVVRLGALGVARVRRVGRVRAAFVVVYAVLGLALLAAAYGAGRGTGYLRVERVPVYCRTLPEFTGCVREIVAATAGHAPSATKCSATDGKHYLCDVRLSDPLNGDSCFDVSVLRAREGFPLLETATQRPSC